MPYGYYTQSGYMGKLPSGEWRLFPTQDEYAELVMDMRESQEKSEVLHLADA